MSLLLIRFLIGLYDGVDDRAGFVSSFISFHLQVGIQHRATTGLHMGNAVLHEGGANHDTGVKITVRLQITHGTAVTVAFFVVQTDKLTAWL